jgi:hypothetical protein
MFSRPTNERYHPAGLIFSTLGAILILFICYKLKIHFPRLTRSKLIEAQPTDTHLRLTEKNSSRARCPSTSFSVSVNACAC